jgi:hypothetical protein
MTEISDCGFFVGGNKKKKMNFNSKNLEKAKSLMK